MSMMQPQGLAQMLAQPAGDADPKDPLGATQDVIDDVHKLMVTLKDPADVEQVGRALLLILGVQKRLMGTGGPASAPPQ